MKKLQVISAVMIFFAAFNLSSCSDVEPIDPSIVIPGPDTNPNPNPNPNPSTGVFKVDFDGQTYTATTVQAIVTSDYIAITAIRGTNAELFQITIPEAEEGTYTWDNPGAVMALAYSNNDGGSAFISTSDETGDFASFPEYIDTATITITDLDMENETITGTFQFTGARFVGSTGTEIETKEFTNGSFSLSFAADVPSPTNNSFSAKLDGATFTPTNILASTSLGRITVVGRRGNIENISVAFPDDIAPGTYELDMFADYVGIYVMNNTGEGTFGASGGTITILSHNTSTDKIKGTFNFTATSFFSAETHEITDGAFEVEY